MKKYTNIILAILISIFTVSILIEAPYIGEARLKEIDYRIQQQKNNKNEQMKKWFKENKDQIMDLYQDSQKEQQTTDQTIVTE